LGQSDMDSRICPSAWQANSCPTLPAGRGRDHNILGFHYLVDVPGRIWRTTCATTELMLARLYKRFILQEVIAANRIRRGMKTPGRAFPGEGTA